MDRIAMLQQILAQNPNDAFARYGLAIEYANRGDSDTALSEFARRRRNCCPIAMSSPCAGVVRYSRVL